MAYTVLGQISPAPLQLWQAHWSLEPNGATGCKGHFERKGKPPVLGMACVFAGCSCTAGIIIERGNHHMLCVRRTFACPCVAGGCSCTRNPSGGDRGDFTLAHFFPCSPTQSRANKTGPFLRKSRLANTGSSVFVCWSGDFQS